MKIITTIIAVCSWAVLLGLPVPSMGQQPWTRQIRDQKNPNFYQVQQAFNAYWNASVPAGKGAVIPKGKGYKPFKRWEWFWEPRVGKQGVFPRASVVMEEWQQYQASHPAGKKPAFSGRLLFPGKPLQGQDNNLAPGDTTAQPVAAGKWVALGPASAAGGYSGVGRLNCIAFHPSDPNTFWVGSPAGGLWKTTTGGTSWTTLTDNLPVLGVSAIAVDPLNPSTLYLATGDDILANTYAVGVLKSTDGGTTWNTTGLSQEVTQGMLVTDLVIHPLNPLILVAATNVGIYRSTDGGTTWRIQQLGYFQNVLFKPGDPKTLYTSTLGDAKVGGAQIFTSRDTGATWSQASSFSGINRIALAVTPARPAQVSALCSYYLDSGFGGYYTSVDSGKSFSLTYATGNKNLLSHDDTGTATGGQGWYDLCLAISPANANVIYAGGVNTWKSTDGGRSWAINTMWLDGKGVPTVHADKHYMAYNPLSPGTLYQCNDGGLYKTADEGASWTDLSAGLAITQFYRMGNSATNAALTLAGAQDNGTKVRRASTFNDVIGGDGMEAIIDYSDANTMYGSYQNGAIFRSEDGGANFSDISLSLPPGAWVTPYVIDPSNPATLYAGVGGNIYKTTDKGSSWVAISSALSANELQSLAVAPSNNKTIYAASYHNLYKTTAGGGSWTTVVLPDMGSLTSIEVHPTNPKIVWITSSGYLAGSKVFRTDNGGASWTNLSGTLPNLPVNTLEYDKNTGVLYVGTDVGVFVRSAGMSDWQEFDGGLPRVIVMELEIQYEAARLRAATFGRGLWESDLYGAPGVAYCVPVYSQGCGEQDYIHNFSFHTLVNNNTGCSNGTAPGYTNYGPAGTLATVVSRGQSYPLSVQSGSLKAQDFGVWIDFNGDKDFNDVGEWVYGSPAAATTVFNANVLIPATAVLGPTRMRVRARSNGLFAGGESCTAVTYGETEDYTITIAPPAAAATQWNYRFGGSDNDSFTSVIKTSDGGYLLGGYSASPAGSDKTQSSQGGQDYWIVKVSSTGIKQWDKRFGGAAHDFLITLIPTSDGGYLLGGNSRSGIGGDKTQAGRGGYDYWVVKISSTGAKQWNKRFGGTGDEELRALFGLPSGDYLLAGVSGSGAGGDRSESSQGGQDYWVVKVSSTGTKLWDKRFGGAAHDNLEAAIATSDGGCLLGGHSASGAGGNKTQGSRGGQDYWIVKISSTGAKQWDKRFGGTAHDELYGLVQNSDGSYLLAGTSASGIGGDRTQASQGGQDYWMVKISSTGTRLWDTRFGGAATDELRAVIATTAGGYLLGGRSDSGLSGDKTQGSQGLADYWIVNTSSTGAKQWDKRFGGTADEELRMVLQTSDGGYLLGGRSDSGAGGDRTQGSRGLSDYWIVKVGSSGSTAPVAAIAAAADPGIPLAERASEKEEHTLFASPNPFSQSVKLHFTLARRDRVSLKVYNEQGAEVANLFEGVGEAGKQHTYEWQAGHHKAGIYIVQLATTSSSFQKKIVLTR